MRSVGWVQRYPRGIERVTKLLKRIQRAKFGNILETTNLHILELNVFIFAEQEGGRKTPIVTIRGYSFPFV